MKELNLNDKEQNKFIINFMYQCISMSCLSENDINLIGRMLDIYKLFLTNDVDFESNNFIDISITYSSFLNNLKNIINFL